MPFASIIIPVYNVPQEFLRRCIISIEEQKCERKNYEIIIVDDGSNDNLAMFIDNLSSIYSNIRVIHKKNGGVSAARNTGIEMANGKYSIFVDSDDYISHDFIIKAMIYCEKYSPDIIYGSIEYVPQRDIKQSNGEIEIFENDRIQYIKSNFLGIEPDVLGYCILGSPCAKVYRTSLAREALFPEGVSICEDQIFNRRMIQIAKRVIVVPDTWYYYSQNEFSAIHQMRRDYFKKLSPYWDEVLREIEDEEDKKTKDKMRVNSLRAFYTVIEEGYFGSSESFNSKMYELITIAQHPLIRDAVENLHYQREYLSVKQMVGLFLLKHKMIMSLYSFRWILKKVHFSRK